MNKTRSRSRAHAFVLALSVAAVSAVVSVSGVKAAPDTDRLDFALHLDRGAAPVIAGHRIATLPQAVRVFGRPARISPLPATPPACRANWPALGLTIDFSTRQPPSCTAQNLGSWAQVTASSLRWHTIAGLHVGDSEARVRALYPHARRLDFLGKGRMWELETGGPFCDGGPPLSLGARVHANHVSALAILHVPACG